MGPNSFKGGRCADDHPLRFASGIVISHSKVAELGAFRSRSEIADASRGAACNPTGQAARAFGSKEDKRTGDIAWGAYGGWVFGIVAFLRFLLSLPKIQIPIEENTPILAPH